MLLPRLGPAAAAARAEVLRAACAAVDVEVEEEKRPSLGAILVGSSSAYGVTPSAAKAPATSSSGTEPSPVHSSGEDARSAKS